MTDPGIDHERSLHLRRHPHADRPLRRRARRTVRTDDLGAIPHRGADASAIPGVDWARRRRRHLRLRQPGRRGQPQRRRAWRCCWPACRSRCRARRSTACAARAWTRSRIAARAIKSGEASLMIAGGVESMIARAVRDGQGRQRVLARGEDRGHDDRLALRQPADEGEVRHRLDARDRRERRRRSSRWRAPTRTRSRCAASSAPRRRSPPAGSPTRSCR